MATRKKAQDLFRKAEKLREKSKKLEKKAEAEFQSVLISEGRCQKCHCRFGTDASEDFAGPNTPAVGRYGVDICPCGCH